VQVGAGCRFERLVGIDHWGEFRLCVGVVGGNQDRTALAEELGEGAQTIPDRKAIPQQAFFLIFYNADSSFDPLVDLARH
jgi:hypothetical protein